jgi:hypothetical protein
MKDEESEVKEAPGEPPELDPASPQCVQTLFFHTTLHHSSIPRCHSPRLLERAATEGEEACRGGRRPTPGEREHRQTRRKGERQREEVIDSVSDVE